MSLKMFKVTKDGVSLSGYGMKGRPYKIYLTTSPGEYRVVILDSETNEIVLENSKVKINSILYYRLKECQELVITNDKIGGVRIVWYI